MESPIVGLFLRLGCPGAAPESGGSRPQCHPSQRNVLSMLSSAQHPDRVVPIRHSSPHAPSPGLLMYNLNVLTSLCLPSPPVYAGFHAGTVNLHLPTPRCPLSSSSYFFPQGPTLVSHRGAIPDGRPETPPISGELTGHLGCSLILNLHLNLADTGPPLLLSQTMRTFVTH